MIEDLKWAAPDRYEVLKELARKNRLMPTLAETELWEQIRGKALGTKFFRQYIIADYIVDFVSLQHNLVIEVDGAYHSELEQQEYDEYRTFRLERLGFRVIRFSNEEIINSIGNVVKTIQTKLLK
ncbi:MAG: endonuclease domain-containing protein [Prevotella sp.]|nr:endonuclease domain-containing protein [Prevotella sp.]